RRRSTSRNTRMSKIPGISDLSSRLRLTEPRFSLKEQAVFAKRLSLLVKAGIPILEGLTILNQQARTRTSKRVMSGLLEDVSTGKSLHKAMARYSRAFGEFAVNLVQVGEASGTLAENL